MKIFHFSDLHTSPKTLDQVRRCCDFLVQQAQEQRPDLIILAGDTYDSRDIRLDSEPCKYMFGFVQTLSDIAPVFIVRGTPFHEGNAIHTLKYVRGYKSVIVADYPETYLLLQGGGIIRPIEWGTVAKNDIVSVISAMPTPTKQFLEDDLNIKASNDNLASALTPIFAKFGSDASQYPDVPHILGGHFCGRGAAISETQTMIGKDIEIGRDQIEMANVDLGCLGHIHLHQEIWKNWFYSGSVICKNHGETDVKGFYCHEIDKLKGTLVSTFIPTPVDKLLRIREDFTAEDNPDVSLALQKYRPDELRGAFLKVEITLWQDQAVEWTKAKILDYFKPCDCASVEVDLPRLPRQNIRNEQILRADNLTEKISILAVQNKETLSEGILNKCELLQSTPLEEIIKMINAPGKKMSPEQLSLLTS